MEKKKLTVAEILAAARKADGGGKSAEAAKGESAPAPPAKPAAEAPAVDAIAAKPAPSAKPAAAGGARPNVADILAQARANKESGAAPEKPAVAKPAAAKPTPKEAVKKESPKPAPQPVEAAGPKDTGSILSDAPKGTKPGPMSKSEAALKAPAAKAASPKAPSRPVPPMPVKPAYAVPPKPKQPVVNAARRSLLFGILFGSFLATGFTTMTTTFVVWALATARFMFPNILIEPPSKFKVGFPSGFAPGQVENKFKAQFGIWVVNWEYNGQSQIYALRTVCTHLGCTPNWLESEQKFKCPCHGSGFYKDGINFEGPAPRPLERYAIRVADDGQLEIDKSKIFQEELGQWKDPDSFVAV